MGRLKKRATKLEFHLTWMNELSAGVGLVLGYVFYVLVFLATPEKEITITAQQPILKPVQIGLIPDSRNNNAIESNISTESKNPPSTYPVIVDSAAFSEEGALLLERKELTFKGQGDPVVSANRVEVLIPKLTDIGYYLAVSDNDETVNRYRPEIYYVGSGLYYDHKVVTFKGEPTAELYAVRTATFFALLSLVLLAIRAWLKREKQIEEDRCSNIYDEDYLASHGGTDEECMDIVTEKRQYQSESRILTTPPNNEEIKPKF